MSAQFSTVALSDDRLVRLGGLARRLPKTELHVHIEGTLEPEMLLRLADRHGVHLPWTNTDEVRRAYDFHDLQSFLDIYYAGASVLRDEDDFEALCLAYLRRAAADGVVHAEMFFDPQTHLPRGVDFGRQMIGLTRGIQRAKEELGIEASLIMCFLRHLSEQQAFETLEAAIPWRDQLTGIGLDSSELGHPPEKFERVFRLARRIGWRVVAHAGEEGPAEYISTAVHQLGAERIDHGIRCLDDPDLVRMLVERRIPLTVCPLSNLKLRVVPTMSAHPLRDLLRAGVVACVNSDDPAYFGGYLGANFDACIEALPLTAGDVIMLASHSIEASFMPNERKTRYLEDIRHIMDGAS